MSATRVKVRLRIEPAILSSALQLVLAGNPGLDVEVGPLDDDTSGSGSSQRGCVRGRVGHCRWTFNQGPTISGLENPAHQGGAKWTVHGLPTNRPPCATLGSVSRPDRRIECLHEAGKSRGIVPVEALEIDGGLEEANLVLGIPDVE